MTHITFTKVPNQPVVHEVTSYRSKAITPRGSLSDGLRRCTIQSAKRALFEIYSLKFPNQVKHFSPNGP